MAVANSSIEWTDSTWSPLTGCTEVSPGCDHCYARTMHERFNGKGSFDTVTLRPDRLDQPLRWRKPRRIFVNSMSDLFHKDVPDGYIADAFAVMAKAERHTFQLLTKRHGRMRSLLGSVEFRRTVARKFGALHEHNPDAAADWLTFTDRAWPLPNVWLGVSVEDQQRADLRIPALLDTPAAVRWISAEPLLGPVDLRAHFAGHCPEHDLPGGFCVQRHHDGVQHLDWVVTGGESGHGARPAHPNWFRSLRDQCQAAGVAYLHKQNGEWAPAPWHGPDGATHAFTGGVFPDGTRHFMKLGHSPTSLERDATTPPGAQGMRRVGKKAAGRDLDGRTWDEYPTARTDVPA